MIISEITIILGIPSRSLCLWWLVLSKSKTITFSNIFLIYRGMINLDFGMSNLTFGSEITIYNKKSAEAQKRRNKPA